MKQTLKRLNNVEQEMLPFCDIILNDFEIHCITLTITKTISKQKRLQSEPLLNKSFKRGSIKSHQINYQMADLSKLTLIQFILSLSYPVFISLAATNLRLIPSQKQNLFEIVLKREALSGEIKCQKVTQTTEMRKYYEGINKQLHKRNLTLTYAFQTLL